MQIIRNLEYIPNLVLALGFYDGVHLGHQKVIGQAVGFAQRNNLKSAVITFKEHPLCILKNISPQYIVLRNDSYKMIENLGADYIIELDFSKISQMSATDYLEQILIKYFRPKAIFSGYNHCFGLNRQGNSEFLNKFQDKYLYKYFRTEAQTVDDKIISSTAIRTALKTGQIGLANRMLGYNFFVEGIVIEGQKLGRTIGFPTININYPANIVELPFGVFASSVEFGNKLYKGIANFGVKPTVSTESKKLLEVHILDFDKDIYNRIVRVNFERMLRPERKFPTLNDLCNQITVDISELR